MKHARGPLSGAMGMTIIELLIAMAVAAVLIGVIVQTFIVSTRTADRESKQSDVHFGAERVVKMLSQDASESWAVLSALQVPSGWSDSGHAYTTTASSDDAGTPEDDRFTVAFLAPSLRRAGGATSVVLNASGKGIGAFDAIVWTFTETTGQAQTHLRRYDVKRACYPAVALASASYSYSAGGNTLTVGSNTYTLDREWGTTVALTNAIQASEDETGWSGTGEPPLGRRARPAIVLKDRDGQVVGQSPQDNNGSELQSSTPPPSQTADLSSDEVSAVPFMRGTTSRASVSDASLADFRMAACEQATGTYSGHEGQASRASIHTSTDNRLRNKRDWR